MNFSLFLTILSAMMLGSLGNQANEDAVEPQEASPIAGKEGPEFIGGYGVGGYGVGGYGVGAIAGPGVAAVGNIGGYGAIGGYGGVGCGGLIRRPCLRRPGCFGRRFYRRLTEEVAEPKEAVDEPQEAVDEPQEAAPVVENKDSEYIGGYGIGGGYGGVGCGGYIRRPYFRRAGCFRRRFY